MAKAHPRRPASAVGSTTDEKALLAKSNTELDEIFGAGIPGDIPVGPMQGTVLLFPGTWLGRVTAAAAYRVAWQGKTFNAERGDLTNSLTPLRVQGIRALVYFGNSWVDDRPCIVIDYSKTSWVARMVRDETRLIGAGVHLGVVWLWRRRIAYFVLRPPAHRKH